MIINSVIESKDGGTLVLDFPRSIYDVYEKLQSVGIRQSPHQITLSDEEGDDVRVKLYSEDETGKHLLLTLKEQNSLADANMLAFMVDNAKPDFRSKLEQNLLNDQYSSMQEVTDDIKQKPIPPERGSCFSAWETIRTPWRAAREERSESWTTSALCTVISTMAGASALSPAKIPSAS